jgi:glycine/D-amino acid oxidase-like deaminating enzyme
MKGGIVGVGNVGATAAFAMVLRGAANEIILIDKDPALARAQAEDILHATPFSHAARIRAGDYADLEGAGVWCWRRAWGSVRERPAWSFCRETPPCSPTSSPRFCRQPHTPSC